jgi:phage shock protein A
MGTAAKGEDMFKRLWNYLKTLFRVKSEQAMDPEIEVEQAIQEARERDQQLRNQAAKVVAHRTMLDQQIEDAAEEAGKAKEMAKQALLRADAATRAGNAEESAKWTRTAQALATRLQAASANLESLKKQYEVAIQQADQAKVAVQQNAMRVQELASKRMQLLGSLQQAKMQETVNDAVQSMSSTLGAEGPSLSQVEQKIDQRLAEAQAKAELYEATPEGAEYELEQSVSLAQADATLADLRKELGIGDAPTPESLPAPAEPAPAAVPPPPAATPAPDASSTGSESTPSS